MLRDVAAGRKCSRRYNLRGTFYGRRGCRAEVAIAAGHDEEIVSRRSENLADRPADKSRVDN